MSKLSPKKQIAIKFPIYLSVVYLVFTLIVYILCPYDWPTQKPLLFFSLNILYIIALFVGYQFGQKREIRFRWIEWTEDKTNRLAGIISVMVVINFVMYAIYIFRCYGFKELDFAGLFEQMAIGIKKPGLGYHLHCERQKLLDGPNVMGGTFYTIVSLFWDFFKNSVAIGSVMYFKRLKLYGKVCTVAYFVMVVLFYMSIGTNIQILHIFLIVEMPVILEFFELWYHKRLNGRNIMRLVGLLLLGCLVVALYFGWMMESRSNTYGYNINEYIIGGIAPGGSTPVETTPTESVSPLVQKIENFWISFSSYLTQGYYGMSQALTLNWTPMFGLGNSMFVVDMITDNLCDIHQYTYQAKLELLGWDSKVRWHSIYTWIANDVSFYGVPIIMFMIGAIFGMMFKDAIVTQNPFARISLFFFILLILFIPCNNQIAQSNENLCAFLLLIGIWMICGRSNQKKVILEKE